MPKAHCKSEVLITWLVCSDLAVNFTEFEGISEEVFTKVINTTSARNPKNPSDRFGDLGVEIRRFPSPFAPSVLFRAALDRDETTSACLLGVEAAHFVKSLLKPAVPNTRLQSAFATYRAVRADP